MILPFSPIDCIPLLAGNTGFQERLWMKGEAKINANEFSSPWYEEQYLKSIELLLHLWFISVGSKNMSSIAHRDSLFLVLVFR
ncbi:hypothetical protein O185_27700 [Photorhabdus temperata J3]|uniref:Uncharacterized protein n=1 Tax=Photorhabdus temperata J3 TaxID=1389415 RepID=U7QQC9_PHOTE|nr:hypothetical protein O185_27700 [Photorhabdus temperata J3]